MERQRNEIKETLKAELEGKKAPVPKKEVAKAVPKEDPSAHHSNKVLFFLFLIFLFTMIEKKNNK